jgi:hypothetical protein
MFKSFTVLLKYRRKQLSEDKPISEKKKLIIVKSAIPAVAVGICEIPRETS